MMPMENAGISTIRKSFAEIAKEVKEMEAQKKNVVPKIPESEGGQIEITSMDYNEAMSEINRISLIKRLKKR